MLELKNIGKTFNPGTVNEKIALEGVNLHLDDGDFATIVGSNGAGKSTLFNAIAGEFIADTGTITLDGQRYHLFAGLQALQGHRSHVPGPAARHGPAYDH